MLNDDARGSDNTLRHQIFIKMLCDAAFSRAGVVASRSEGRKQPELADVLRSNSAGKALSRGLFWLLAVFIALAQRQAGKASWCDWFVQSPESGLLQKCSSKAGDIRGNTLSTKQQTKAPTDRRTREARPHDCCRSQNPRSRSMPFAAYRPSACCLLAARMV
jgi:hypothetical protein